MVLDSTARPSLHAIIPVILFGPEMVLADRKDMAHCLDVSVVEGIEYFILRCEQSN